MNTEKMVKEFKLKMGVPPFSHVGYWSPPSKSLQEHNPTAYHHQLVATPPCCTYSCDHCSTPIEHHQIIRDSKGKLFAVGSTCIEKIGDHKLITAAKAAVNKKNREKAKAKREAGYLASRLKREADLEDQRVRNGGLTDLEVRRNKAIDDSKARKSAVEDDHNALLEILKNTGGDWARGMYIELLHYAALPNPEGRYGKIIIEIIAKQGTRKDTKKYFAALPAAEEFYELNYEAVKAIKAKYPLSL